VLAVITNVTTGHHYDSNLPHSTHVKLPLMHIIAQTVHIAVFPPVIVTLWFELLLYMY